MIVGTLIVLALFAALIGPWFVNWNDYRGTFEAEAEKILGHKVHVAGSASATILPSPSLTFTSVEVGDTEGRPMMTVERFEVVIELMPLLQGEIRVISMVLDKPMVRVSIDDAGEIEWMVRSKAAEALDPEKVVLNDVQIRDGAVTYEDARTRRTQRFDRVNATVEARALNGPWRVEGSYLDAGGRVPFQFATGRQLGDGTLRIKTDFSPSQWPVAVAADGVVAIDPKFGITYRGTYGITQVAASNAERNAAANGWRSEGAFLLTGTRLAIEKAILSNGPLERPSSVAGSVIVDFGERPSFQAVAEARQIDLDRTLASGPTQPLEVSAGAQRLVEWLGGLPVPTMPGTVSFKVPAIVVGGSVIQDVAFSAQPAKGGWRISGLHARLPGASTLDADGVLTTDQKVGFVGDVRLAVEQPATFATWWRGRAQDGTGRLLASFDLAGHADVGPGRVQVDQVNARVGDAVATGKFSWSEGARDRKRQLATDLKADRIDFVQLRALAELLVGRNLSDTSVIADSYAVKLTARSFQFEDIAMRDVLVDAEYTNDTLNVVQFSIGDIGGANFRVTSGRIDNVSRTPNGKIDARFEATTLSGLTRIVDRFWPDSGFSRWFRTASPALAPAFIAVKVSAPPKPGETGFAISVDQGVAGASTFNLALKSAGGLGDWREKAASIDLVLNSPDSIGFTRQIGIAATPGARDSGAHVEIHGTGLPGQGMDTRFKGDLAGLAVTAAGKVTITPDLAASYSGSLGLNSANVDPLIAMAGLGIPGAAIGTAVKLDGALTLLGGGGELEWRRGAIGGHNTDGKVSLARDGDRAWRIAGTLAVDEVDVGWLAALGLGFAPVPTGDPTTPWSKASFNAPGYGPVSGKLQVTADRLAVGETIRITGARLDIALQPTRIDADLTAGETAGGKVTGGLSVHNVGGNASLGGRFNLQGAALESFVWQRNGRAVATGLLDLSANFEATGRSPAGLVSSVTGGGVVSVHKGEARYVNPNAAKLVVRASDLGQQFSEDALRQNFAQQIDADSLLFGEASGAFAVAAGQIRLKNFDMRGSGIAMTSNAVVDLNTMQINSDWTLTFDAVDAKVEGTLPRAGLVFRGPIAAPVRIVDVLPLSSYLNMRQEVRMLEIIALDEATRAERERLNRLTRKLREDGARRAEEARAANEREARRRQGIVTQASAFDQFHAARDVFLDQRVAAGLAAFAGRAAADSNAAQAVAAEAARTFAAERVRADATAKLLPGLVQVEQTAMAAEQAAVADFETARKVTEATTGEAGGAAAAAEAAEKAAADAAAAELTAADAAAAAARDKAAADGALKAATARVASAVAASTKADADAAVAVVAQSNAEKNATAAVAVRDAAEADLAAAEGAANAARQAADRRSADATTAAKLAADVRAAKVGVDAAAATAASENAAAVAARDNAQKSVEAAKAAVDAAGALAESAASAAIVSAGAADALAGGPGSEEAKKDAADKASIAAARNQSAGDATKAFELARTALVAADSKARDAAAKLSAATLAATSAAEKLKNLAATESSTASANVTAQKDLAAKVTARDAAAKTLTDRRGQADRAAALTSDAARAATAAADRAASAKSEADKAQAEKAAAMDALAARTVFADTAATAARDTIVARQNAQVAAKAARDRANAAGGTLGMVQKSLAAKSAAADTARSAVKAATDARIGAERALADANVRVAAADATAQKAAALAADKSRAADIARKAAERAAAAVGPVNASLALLPSVAPQAEAVVVPPMLPTVPDLAPAPGPVAGPAVPVPTAAPAPRPKPQSAPQPLRILPNAPPANQPMVIVPRP